MEERFIILANGEEALVAILAACLIIFVVFLILREVVCWYWKINRIVELLEAIYHQLGGKEGRPILPPGWRLKDYKQYSSNGDTHSQASQKEQND